LSIDRDLWLENVQSHTGLGGVVVDSISTDVYSLRE
jgi:hypothetical protein